MKSLKKESTHCRDCGVEFNGVNKAHRRALCVECLKNEQRSRAVNKPKEEQRHIKYKEFKFENRTDYYSALLAETKGMDRDEHRAWMNNKFNEILQNKRLWEFISTQPTNMKAKQNYRKKKLNSSKGLLENF